MTRVNTPYSSPLSGLFHKLLFILLTTYMAQANTLPQRMETSIVSADSNGQVQLAQAIPKGMSGVVIHNYANGLSAITHRITTQGNTLALAEQFTATTHDRIPTIQTKIYKNDKVIIGSFYSNALLIAPNLATYDSITKRFQKTWIHPDAYAVNFMSEGQPAISLSSLKKFANANQIGLILIATQDKILVLDPMSQVFLSHIAITNHNAKVVNPFYTRFQQEDASTFSAFSFSSMDYTDYYQAIKALK